MSDLSQLVHHLRENPSARGASVDALAAEFELSPELVRLAISNLNGLAEAANAPLAKSVDRTPKWRGPRLFDWAGTPPVRLLPWFLAAVLIISTIAQIQQEVHPSVINSLAFMGMLVFAAIVVWRQPNSKTARIMSLVPASCYLTLVATIKGQPLQAAVIFMTTVMLWVFALGVLSLVSVIAGWVALRLEQRNYDRMSRQDMLARLLIVRKTLERSTNIQVREDQKPPLDHVLTTRPWLSTLVAATVLATFSGLAFQANGIGRLLGDSTALMKAGPMQLVSFTIIWLVVVGLSFWTQLKIAANSRNVYCAFAQGLLYQGVSSLIMLSPIGDASTRKSYSQPGLYVIALIQTALIFLVGYSYARLRAKMAEKRLRHELEPTALMAELVELEIRLRPVPVPITVLVIDVVGSTRMKNECDPYEAEWSFREYQTVVARTAAAWGGQVISTAGDGTILSFGSTDDAVRAARATASAVGTFNEEKNEMELPFTMRMGLHHGEVMGDLGEVQFTQVIDIAAHVERISPVGGLALTESAKRQLSVPLDLEVGSPVDGEGTFVLRSLLTMPESGPTLVPNLVQQT